MAGKRRRTKAGDPSDDSGPSRPRFSIDNLEKCSSHFSKYEEEALRMEIIGTPDLEDIFPRREEFPVPPALGHLLLENFSRNEIITFAPTDDSNLGTQQIRFLRRLQRVLLSNDSSSTTKRAEDYVTQMIDILFTEVGFDDGIHLEMLPSKLSMTIGARRIATYVDKEGRLDNKIIWAVHGSKHAADPRYRGGLVQLIAGLISGCQQNYSMASSQIIPEAMYGFNVRGEEVSIIRAEFTMEYIESLFGGLPTEPLPVFFYPPKSGLKLADPAHRRQLLGMMSALKEDALSTVVSSITSTGLESD